MINTAINGISSMATRALLAELAATFEHRTGNRVTIESVGGLVAMRRLRAGEDFDLVVLAADAIDALMADGHLMAAKRFDLVRSGVAAAVRLGSPCPDLGSEEAVRDAVLSARSIAYSTGPSGVGLARLFIRWGIADAIASRIITAPPGVPVGELVAAGRVELGFQQLSELIHLPGISIAGSLPLPIQIVTTFAAGIGIRSAAVDRVSGFLEFTSSQDSIETIRRHGMEPASEACDDASRRFGS